MSIKARAIRTLYRSKKININGVHKAVEDGLITDIEYKKITGEDYI